LHLGYFTPLIAYATEKHIVEEDSKTW